MRLLTSSFIATFSIFIIYGCTPTNDVLANNCTNAYSNYMYSKLSEDSKKDFSYKFINAGYKERGERIVVNIDMEMTVIKSGQITYDVDFVKLLCRSEGDMVYYKTI